MEYAVRAGRKYVNGYEDGENIVLLYRNAAGALCKEPRRAEYASFHPAEQFTAELLRNLRNSAYVSGLTVEGKYVRIRWANEHVRREACADEVWRDNKQVPGFLVTHGVVTRLEADVSPIRRFFADTGAQVATPRRAYLDIETDSRVPPTLARQGRARVLAWAVADDTKTVVGRGVLSEDTDEAEAELLSAMWASLADYDQIAAWFGDIFDFPIIQVRTEKVGARVPSSSGNDYRRWIFIDHAEIFERMNRNASESGGEKESRALQHVAMETVGEGKNDFDASKTWEEWEAGGERRAAMLAYCAQDVLLLPKIEAKTGYLATNASVCEACGVFANTKNANPLFFIDGFMLRLGASKGHRFPTPNRPKEGEEVEHFAGAYVLEPQETGIRKNVHVFDFSGMYPSIILTFNIAAETKDPSCPVNGPIPSGVCRSPATRVGFKTGVRGIVCDALLEIRARRAEWQKKQANLPPGTPEWYDAGRRSNAYKVVANSFYGAMGSTFGRYYDRQLAESTTQTGVYLIRRTLEAAEARGMKKLYGDTDSGFVENATREQVAEFIVWCNAELYPTILRESGCTENFIEVAYEKEFERIVFLAKKRYAGVYRHYKWTTSCTCDVEKNGKKNPGAVDMRTLKCRDCGRTWSPDALPPPRGKPEIKGLEYKRGDTNMMARKLQAEAIDLLCRERREDPAAFVPLVEAVKKHVLEDALDTREVTFSKSLTKPLKEYKARLKNDGKTEMAELPHVQVARILKERGVQVVEGSRIPYYVTDGGVSPMKVAPAIDYAQDADRHYLWEKAVYPATQRLLEAAFPPAVGMDADALQLRDWRRFEKSRPRRTRGSVKPGGLEFGTRVPNATPAKPAKSNEAQGGLFDRPVAAPAPPPAAAAPAGPFVIEIARDGSEGELVREARVRKAIGLALAKHPGDREVKLHIELPDGSESRISLGMKVAWSAALVRDVEAAKEDGLTAATVGHAYQDPGRQKRG